jgi:DNA-binding response OmpR family regulator
MPPTQKVVVVEDDDDVQFLYKHRLERDGYTVFTASNGAEGLSVIQQVRPDIVLLDLLMPVMNGVEMLARLRAEDWGSSVRVIILTNISQDEAPEALRLLHVARYVVKAHQTPAQVAALVREVLSS